MAWETEPGAGSRGRQDNAEPEPPAVEDERFLDHHIEEMLAAFDTMHMRERGDAEGQRLE